MIFSVDDHINQIIAGTKTQTRRMSNMYILGSTYSIQPGRSQPAIPDGRILILHKHVETKGFDWISETDAFAEGGYTPEEFEELFSRMYPRWKERYVYTFRFIPAKEAES